MLSSEALKILRREGLRPTRTLTMAITGACNLACRHSWVGAGGGSAAAHVPERTLRRLIEEFVALDGEGAFAGGQRKVPCSLPPGWISIGGFCTATIRTPASGRSTKKSAMWRPWNGARKMHPVRNAALLSRTLISHRTAGCIHVCCVTPTTTRFRGGWERILPLPSPRGPLSGHPSCRPASEERIK